MIRRKVNLTAADYALLRAAAASLSSREGRPVSWCELVRRALPDILKQGGVRHDGR